MKKILVAEDNPANRELMREVLSSPEYEVLEASDGLEALRKIEDARPDLVLLDIQLPVLDGFAVLNRIRTNPEYQGLRVLAVTANAMREDREKGMKAGFDAYISKPIDIAALRRHVASLLER